MPLTPKLGTMDAVPVACTPAQADRGVHGGAIVSVGLDVYPLPLPPEGMEREARDPEAELDVKVAVALGVPPTGEAPENDTAGGCPTWYAPPVLTAIVF